MRTKTAAAIILLFAGVARAQTPLTADLVSASAGRLGETLVGGPRPAEPGVLPSHLRYTFDEVTLSDKMELRQPQLLIIPIAEYSDALLKEERRDLANRIKFLHNIIDRNGGELANEIPIFPIPQQKQKLRAAARELHFREGAGVRFITSYARENTPATNATLLYAFEGFTKDGQYLVSFLYPVSVQNLPITEDASFAALFMDQLQDDGFTPSLDKLDEFVQSITFKQPSPK